MCETFWLKTFSPVQKHVVIFRPSDEGHVNKRHVFVLSMHEAPKKKN